MPNDKKNAKGRLDKFYYLAKEQGYRSRAAFKLVQLDRKYGFLTNGQPRGVLDLCAAPGGWMQVARKQVPKTCAVVGIDLDPIKPIKDCSSLVGDITSAKSAAQLKRLFVDLQKNQPGVGSHKGGPVIDIVLHDGAPNVGSAWLHDAFGQNELVLASLRLAVGFLSKGGWFVTKVFRSKDYNSLIWVFKQLFDKVEATKPTASRAVSAEIFVVCGGFKKPKSVDPRLLDPKYVFAEVEPGSSAAPLGEGNNSTIAVDDDEDMDQEHYIAPETRESLKHAPMVLSEADAYKKLFARKLPRQKAEGYADGSTVSAGVMFEVLSAARFIHGEDPMAVLVGCREITFKPTRVSDEERKFCLQIERDPLTNHEVLDTCSDLRSAGKTDLRNLLKWRDRIREKNDIKSPEQLASEAAEAEAEAEELEKQARLASMTEDEKLTMELQERIAALNLKKKKVLRKLRAKRKARQYSIDIGMVYKDDILDQSDIQGPEGLFRATGTAKVPEVVQSGNIDDHELESSSSESDVPPEPKDDSDVDSDVEYLHRIEQELAINYKHLEAKRRGIEFDASLAKEEGQREISKTSVRRLREAREAAGYAPPDEEEDMRVTKEIDDLSVKRRSKVPMPSLGSGKELSSSAMQWFNQDTMTEAPKFLASDDELAGSDDDSDSYSDPVDSDVADSDDEDSDASSHDDDDQDQDDDEDMYRGDNPKKRRRLDEAGNSENSSFKVVPRENAEDLYEGMDDEARASALALGSMLANGKIKRHELEDNSYNRYQFGDLADSSVPEWFVDDESRHNKPEAPVTKDQINEFKRLMRDINARPIKKVAEAKARKKIRASRKLAKIKAQAEAIADTDDLTPGEKMRQIETLYRAKKSAVDKKVDRKYVVARAYATKSGGRDGGRRTSSKTTKYVDGKSKKDSRGLKASVRRNTAKSKSKASRKRKHS